MVDLDQYLMNNTTAYNTTFLRKVAKCVDHAKALMCSSAFPYCSPDTLLTRPICKNSCQEFAPGGACEGVFDLEQFPGLREIMTSNCDARVHPAGESPECVHLSLEIPPISGTSEHLCMIPKTLHYYILYRPLRKYKRLKPTCSD